MRLYRLLRHRLKFIPVRGRKHVVHISPAIIDAVEIYPREGTETFLVVDNIVTIQVEIYPREGTETRTSDIFPLLHVLKFIPVRGRKRSCVIVIIVAPR